MVSREASSINLFPFIEELVIKLWNVVMTDNTCNALRLLNRKVVLLRCYKGHTSTQSLFTCWSEAAVKEKWVDVSLLQYRKSSYNQFELLQKSNKNKTGLGFQLVLWLGNNCFFKKHGLVLALDLKDRQDHQVCSS